MNIDMEKVSYVLGYSIASDFKSKGFDVDPDIFIDAFQTAFAGKPSTMRMSEMQQTMMAFQNAVRDSQQANQAQSGERNLEKGKTFLAENGKKGGVVTTDSGLQYRVITEGAGRRPALSDQITAHYEGKTIDGKIFDSSI